MTRDRLFSYVKKEYGVEPESSVSDEEIKNLINLSYRLTDKAGSKGRGGN
ncbi:MAG: hypothetical protein LUI14_00380 [Lachnospiraceae bacterium]|nr:hypothetical protein [Lachnospiraceae bacterium]